MFSAYKGIHITQRLANAKEKDIYDIDKTYNTDYLRAEKGHFARSAQGAKNWSRYERDKAVYPFLEFIPSVSANPRDSHRKFYGIIRPITDSFWNTYLPPIEWECKCSVQQRQSDDGTTNPDLSDIKVPKSIQGNPYKTKQIITEKHPMVAVIKAKAANLVPELQKWEACGFAGRKRSDLVKFTSLNKGYVIEFSNLEKESEYVDNKSIAKHFAKRGDAVELLDTILKNNVKRSTADALINGVIHEFKTCSVDSVKRIRKHLYDISNKKGKSHKKQIIGVLNFTNKKVNTKNVIEAITRSYKAGDLEFLKEIYFIQNGKLSKKYSIQQIAETTKR